MIGNLAKLGLGYLKVDGSYIRGIDQENDKRLFIEAMQRAANSIDLPLIAERGYHIEAPTSGPMLPPRVFEDRSMIVTRFGDRLRAASFVEFSRADLPPDPRKWARLHAHVAELGLAFERETVPWYGSRPTLPDYLPAIGRVPGAANLVAAFGHNHLGLTLSAVTGEIVAAMLVGDTAPDPAFALSRF